MNIFEWDEQTPVTANNMNEMQNILNNNISEAIIENYSTTEQIIGKWIDDKPIYRKVVQTTTGTTTNLWTKIVNLQIDTLISKYGYWIAGSDRYPLDRSYNNEEITLYWKSDGIYEIHNYSYANNRQAILIIDYTKPTN